MESSLSLKKQDYEAAVGRHLGFGRGELSGEPAWSNRQYADIKDCVKSGLRRFYQAHNWSFLRPVATLTLASGGYTADLPDDFGNLEGMVRVTSPTSSARSFRQTGRVRMLRAEHTATRTGPPEECEVEPIRGTTATSGQRFRLAFWPTADQAYTLEAVYSLHPDALFGDRPYPYGGEAHAETILEACLAVAEERLDNTRGVHAAAFEEMLVRSKRYDQRLKPQHLGYNADRSDGVWWDGRRDRLSDGYTVTIGGVTPT